MSLSAQESGQGGPAGPVPLWWGRWSLAIIVAGVVTRFIDLGYGFDGDENFSASLASRPWEEMLTHALGDRTQAPLHLILLSAWHRITGEGEGWLRLSSVLSSLGFLLVLRQLAREQLEPWPGLLLVMIGALGTFFVVNGQQLRPYSLALLLASLSLLYFMRLLTRGWSLGSSMGWGLATACAISSSYVLAIHAVVQLGLLMMAQRGKAFLSLLSLAIGLLPVGIWAWFAFARTDSLSGGLGLIGWIARPLFLDFSLFYIDLMGTLPGLPHWVSLWLVLVLALPALLGCLGGEGAPKLRVLLVLALAPVLVVFIASQVLPVSLWATRQMTASAVVAILFLTMGFNGRAPRLMVAACGVISVWLLIALPAALPKATKPPWRELITSHVLGHDHQAVIINPADGWIRGPLERYLPAETLRFMQDVGPAIRPKSPLLVCRPRRCDEVLERIQAAGYRVCNQQEYAWRSFGLVGTSRITREGSPTTWFTPGGEPNAWLTVMTLCDDAGSGKQ